MRLRTANYTVAKLNGMESASKPEINEHNFTKPFSKLQKLQRSQTKPYKIKEGA